MKKIIYAGVVLVVVIGVIALLFNNRSKLAAQTTMKKIESYSVSIDTVGKRFINNELELVGTLAGSNDVEVVSESMGKVVKVFAKVGDYKSAGSVLFQLDDELKYSAFKTAEVNFEKAKKDNERLETLYKSNTVSISQLEGSRLALQSAEAQFIAAKRQFDDTRIKAPISGVITSRNADLGTYVNGGMKVANIVDLATLKVKLSVAESDVFRIKTGDIVDISTDVYPSVIFKGRIETISPKGDEGHTYPVEITLKNNGKNPLKSGMFAKVKFTSIKGNESIYIPRMALTGSIKEPKVFIVENGIAKLKNILVGHQYENLIEVTSGIKVGDAVVVNGQNNLKDNDKVIVRVQ